MRGFTLIELLVIIAIMGILAGIVMASISGTQEKTEDSKECEGYEDYTREELERLLPAKCYSYYSNVLK